MGEVGRVVRRAAVLGAAAGLVAGAWVASFGAFGAAGLRVGAGAALLVGLATYIAVLLGPTHRARRRLDGLTDDPVQRRRLRDAVLADRVRGLSDEEIAMAPAHARAHRDERCFSLAGGALGLLPLTFTLLLQVRDGSPFTATFVVLLVAGTVIAGAWEVRRIRRFQRWLDRNAPAASQGDLA